MPAWPAVARWTDVGMARGGAQVRDARDLVPVRQATAGTADHVGGFSYARTAARPSSPRWVGNRLATRLRV
ncbi:hypothetical protein ACH4HG_29720 [Streptomyces coeruleorubidus]|uniref:hypothetical protein n=1 Tax=Streptomyces coeruleorubidus TaxID=116188 RepID=UPI00378CE525